MRRGASRPLVISGRGSRSRASRAGARPRAAAPSSPSDATTASRAVRVPSSARSSRSVGSSTSARKPSPSSSVRAAPTTVQPSLGETTCSKRAAGATASWRREQRVRAGRRRVDAGEHPQQMARGGLERPRRQARAARPVGAVAAPQHERAVGERLDPELAVVRRPAVERGAELLRPVSTASRVQAAAFESGSSVVVCRIHASQPEPSSHSRGRTAGSSPACAQLAISVAKPPGSSRPGSPRASSSLTRSPGRPLSRKVNSASGETT